MKCHWCKKDLQEFANPEGNIKTLECPDAHCEFEMSIKPEKIIRYVIWVDIGETRYKIKGMNTESLKSTRLLVKKYKEKYKFPSYDAHAPYPWSTKRPENTPVEHYFDDVLEVKRFYKPAIKEDVVQGYALFDKLKTLVIFS